MSAQWQNAIWHDQIDRNQRVLSVHITSSKTRFTVGRVKACFGGVDGKSPQPSLASKKIQKTLKTASLWWVEQRSLFFSSSFILRYTTNQAMGKVPKPISTSACRDIPVTVGKLGNVMSGKQAMLTQRSSSCKKKETNQLKSQHLIYLRRWLDYQ